MQWIQFSIIANVVQKYVKAQRSSGINTSIRPIEGIDLLLEKEIDVEKKSV